VHQVGHFLTVELKSTVDAQFTGTILYYLTAIQTWYKIPVCFKHLFTKLCFCIICVLEPAGWPERKPGQRIYVFLCEYRRKRKGCPCSRREATYRGEGYSWFIINVDTRMRRVVDCRPLLRLVRPEALNQNSDYRDMYVPTSFGIRNATSAACVFVTSDLEGEISFVFGPKYLGLRGSKTRKLRHAELHGVFLQTLPCILESNPHPFYGFRGLKIRCGLDSRSKAGFWKNDRAAVRAIRTIQ
jgi:hypothetical protein